MSSVKHVKRFEPDSEWEQEALGSLTKLKNIVGGIIGNAIAAAASFIWAHWIVGTLVVAAGVFVVSLVLVTRHFRLQRMRSDIRLHEFCHHTRDEVAKIISLGKPEALNAIHALEAFHKATVQRIAILFRELTGDLSVNCCIRIAEQIDGNHVYVTKARSDGLDQIARQKHTVPLPADKGLASALRSSDCEGVYLIPSISEAKESGIWHETSNDTLNDVKTLMVAPVNGYEGSAKAMLGILSVTSKKRNFRPCHTSALMAIVDTLGLVYPILINKVAYLNQAERPKIEKSPKTRKRLTDRTLELDDALEAELQAPSARDTSEKESVNPTEVVKSPKFLTSPQNSVKP